MGKEMGGVGQVREGLPMIFLVSSSCSLEMSIPTSSTGSVAFSPKDSLACNRWNNH